MEKSSCIAETLVVCSSPWAAILNKRERMRVLNRDSGESPIPEDRRLRGWE